MWLFLPALLLLAPTGTMAQNATRTLRNLLPQHPQELRKYTNSNTWGYVLGHNFRFNQQYAEKYYVSGNTKVVGLISHHGGGYTNGNNLASFRVYSVGNNRLPAKRLGGKDVRYTDLQLNGSAMTTTFDTPIAVADSFFVSFDLHDYAHGGYEGDTIGLYSGINGSRTTTDFSNFGRNAVQAHEHAYEKWVDFRTQNFTNVATHFALFPIVEFGSVTGLADEFVWQEDLKLYPVYPNPSTGNLTFRYALSQRSEVRLQILDVTGKTVYTQDFRQQAIGEHFKVVDLSGLPAGTYIYLIQTNGVSLASRLVINQ